MIVVLADHDIEGQADLLWSALARQGWLELVPMQLVRFREVGLAAGLSDRQVWQFAQSRQMILLTGNRNREGADSLEQTIRDANESRSVPIITISRPDRMVEASYRDLCATRLTEIVVYLDNYLGVGRLYIP